MKPILYFAFITGAVSLGAQAATSACLTIENDLDRLACYDLEAGRTPATQDIQTESQWQTRLETSAMTDQTNVYMNLESEEVVNCGWATQKIVLIVRCRENTTSVIFSTGCHMTSSDYSNYGDVTYRVDDAPAQTTAFRESTNNRSLGLWRGGQAIPFVKALFGKERLIARMTPYGENAFTATFNISGLEDEIGPLREACSW